MACGSASATNWLEDLPSGLVFLIHKMAGLQGGSPGISLILCKTKKWMAGVHAGDDFSQHGVAKNRGQVYMGELEGWRAGVHVGAG